MQSESLAERYAAALFEASSDASRQASVLNELMAVKEVFSSSQELEAAFLSPAVSPSAKKRVIGAVCDKLDTTISEPVRNFLNLVVDKGREAYLTAIIDSFEQKIKEHNGVIEARVETASELDLSLNALIRTRLVEITGKKVNMQMVVKPELIAGAVIYFGDRFYDGSVKYHLDALRQHLSKH